MTNDEAQAGGARWAAWTGQSGAYFRRGHEHLSEGQFAEYANALESEVAVLRQALEPFVRFADASPAMAKADPDAPVFAGQGGIETWLTARHFLDAAAALRPGRRGIDAGAANRN